MNGAGKITGLGVGLRYDGTEIPFWSRGRKVEYYKVYDVRTGELLDTHALTQSPTNSRLFIKTVQAPPDPTGYGRNIVAIATVYTDSSYTTKSESYEEQEQYYLIKSIPLMLGGGGGGIDYQHLKEMMKEVVEEGLAQLPPAQPLPEFPFGSIGALQREVNRIPKDASDTTPLIKRVESIQRGIEALPSPEKLDLTALSKDLNELRTFLEDRIWTATEQTGTKISAANEKVLRQFLGTLAREVIARAEAGIKDLMVPSPIDVSHLM